MSPVVPSQIQSISGSVRSDLDACLRCNNDKRCCGCLQQLSSLYKPILVLCLTFNFGMAYEYWKQQHAKIAGPFILESLDRHVRQAYRWVCT